MSFEQAEREYRTALAHHLELLQRGKIDNAYRQSGRRAIAGRFISVTGPLQ